MGQVVSVVIFFALAVVIATSVSVSYYLRDRNKNIFKEGPTGPTGGDKDDISTTGPTGPTGANSSPMGPTGFSGPNFLSLGPTGFSASAIGPTGDVIGPSQGINHEAGTATFFNDDGYSNDVDIEKFTYGSATVLIFDNVTLTRPGTTGPSPIRLKITEDPTVRYNGSVAYLVNLQGVRYSPYEYFTVTSDGQNPYFNLALGSRGLTWGDASDTEIRIFMSILLGKN